MNTQELERLADWDEQDLCAVVAELVRRHGRLPSYEQLSTWRPPRQRSARTGS